MQCTSMEHYFDTLEPPYPTTDIVAEITKATYKMNARGKLLVTVRSTYDSEIRKIETRDKIRILNIFTCPEVRVQDKFLVYHINKTTNMWVKVGSNSLFTTAHSIYVDLRHVIYCPFCGKQLKNTIKGKYCFNPVCKNHICHVIRRFLQIATQVDWNIEELAVFDTLVTKGKIKRLPEIYDIGEKMIDDLNLNLKVNKDKPLGKHIVDKINQTRGTVTIFNFLQSLNLPNEYNWFIDKEKLEKSYNQILPFYYDVLNNRNYLQVPHPMYEYMSKETHLFLYAYFNSEEFYTELCELINEDVFDTYDQKVYDGWYFK